MNDRRAGDTPLFDTARMLALIYTLGYFGVVFVVLWNGIPPESKDVVLQLIGILSIIQTGIVAFYFGGSKAKERSDSVMQEIAKAPIVSATVAAAANERLAGTEGGEGRSPGDTGGK